MAIVCMASESPLNVTKLANTSTKQSDISNELHNLSGDSLCTYDSSDTVDDFVSQI